MNHPERSPSTPPAGLLRRLAAIAYDLLIVLALLMVATIASILVRGGTAISPGSVWFQMLLLAIWWLYFAWSWAERGQTVGMRAWKLVLTSDDGDGVSWARASLRFLAAGLSTVIAGLGFLWSLFDRDRRAWHDRLSRTSLSDSRESAKPRDSESRDRE